MREEKDLATQKLTETLEALRNCALQNNMLQSALEARPSEPPGGVPRAALPPPNGSSDDEAVTGVDDDDCKPCAALLEQITAAMDGSLAVKREPGAEAPCWGDEAAWDTTSPSFLEQGQVQGDPWSQIGSTFGSGVEWLFKLMPGMRGKLYGRSLTPPCRCEGARRPPPSGTLPQGPLCRQHTRISGRDSW